MTRAILAPLRRLPNRSEALESHLSRWRDWQVSARCQDECCPPNPSVAITDIQQVRGDLTVRGMTEGLRCTACGATVQNVSLVRLTPGGQISLPVRGAAVL